MKLTSPHRLLPGLILLLGTVAASGFTHTVNNPIPAEGAPYKHQIVLGPNQTVGFSDHVGAWSWEDDSLFGEGEAPVGWTHTSNWVALSVQNDTVITLTMARDTNVPDPTLEDPDRKADTSSMFPSLTLWRGLDGDGDQGHTYNNRGNVSWAEKLSYLDHVDNSTAETITRTWFLRKGDYTLALGSNAPANNPLSQGFQVTFTTGDQVASDPVPVPGGVGYAHTVTVRPGSAGHFSNYVGAWSWEDNALFDPGEQPVGWTHTSRWMALNVDEEEVLFTLKIERDANVPWPSQDEPERLADTASMFPSFTLWRNWQNTGADSHTYFNRGNVIWAPELRYMDHVDNSTATSITRTYRLKRGQYTFAIGSNAPATNTLRQGFKLSYNAIEASDLIVGDPVPGGISYNWMASVGANDSGSVSNHVGSWSWEDTRLFTPGQTPVGWTHHSNWLALNVTEPVSFTITMNRNPNVPWPSESDPDRKAAIDEMFPSLTVWRGLHNAGSDSHTYHNRGNIDWAPGLQYLDHIDNTSDDGITRTWTLMPGQYSFALGSNSPENTVNPQRQGYTFAWTTSAPAWEPPVITGHPRSATVLSGKPVSMSVRFKGENVEVQWFKDGRPIPGARNPLYQPSTAEGGSALYTAEVRNGAGWLHSNPATLTVISIPVLDPETLLPPLEPGQLDPALPSGAIGQVYSWSFGANNAGSSLRVTGLPRGLKYNAKTNSVSGIPLVSGNFDITLVASNRAGKSTPLLAKLHIAAMPVGTVATFTGALARTPLMNNQLGGHVQISITSLGGYSAVLKLGTQTLRKSGNVIFGGGDTIPEASFDLPRPGQATVTLAFQLFGNGVARGTISDGQTTLPFEARARATAAEAAGFVHGYTFAMEPGGDQLGDDKVPQGYCLGGFACAANGTARGSILLPDDTAFTFSAPLETGGHLSLFNLLYKNTGSLVAVFHMQDETANGNMRLSEVSLFKHVQRGGKASPYLWQRTGFSPVEMDVIGGRYSASGSVLTTLDIAANPEGNASLEFTYGGLIDPENTLNVNAMEIQDANGADVIINPANNPGEVELQVSGINIGSITGGGGAGKATFKEFTVTKRGVLSTGTFVVTDEDPGTGATSTRNGIMKGLIVFDGLIPRIVGFFQLPVGPTPGSAKTTGKWKETIFRPSVGEK